MIDFSLIIDSFPSLLEGAGFTLRLAFVGAFIGMVLGIILAYLEMGFLFFRSIANLYVALFRGTPMLVQILFLYYVLPQFGLQFSSFWVASLAIGFNSGAYVSQILRTGIGSVPKGQIEASKMLGLSDLQTLCCIIFPQAFRKTLPSLGNELIVLIKDSSLASIIGVMELSKAASLIRSRTYDAFSILLVTACIYLVLTTAVGFLIKKAEAKWRVYA